MKLGTWMLVSLIALALAPACGSDEEKEPTVETNSIVPSPPFFGDPANGAVFGVDISHYEAVHSQAEMDCYWDSGVRHVIAGTQVEEVVRQQLGMAASRGMTIDAYIYLYWNMDMVEQVKEGFRRVAGFPIGRMWLDVEEDPRGLGANEIAALLQQSVDACKAAAGSAVTCGIYTGPGFWESYMNNMPTFGDLPLWYAQYNGKTSLGEWGTEKFGGWAAPIGKQWAEQPLCGVGVDKDTIQVSAKPTVVVDRTLPPDDGKPPVSPKVDYPTDGVVVGLDYLKLMASTVPRATQYQLALEHWNGKTFVSYYTWTVSDAFLKTYPLMHNALYRFRARAKNARGWGEWSAYTTFDYGKYTGTRPGATPPPPPTAPPPTTPPATPIPPNPTPTTNPTPTPTGGPTGLSPDGQTLSTPDVKLSCDAVTGATRYEFYLENLQTTTSNYVPYVTYMQTIPSKVFYPQVKKTTYRFRVRAEVAGAFSPWSNWASFQVN
jgi:GH25 family lysozyme M1 (1,4-beta-N-acetylmuramidase)